MKKAAAYFRLALQRAPTLEIRRSVSRKGRLVTLSNQGPDAEPPQTERTGGP